MITTYFCVEISRGGPLAMESVSQRDVDLRDKYCDVKYEGVDMSEREKELE